MKLTDITILIAIFMMGCVSTQNPKLHQPVSVENYNEEELFLIAENLGLRPVDYLHYANNPDRIHHSFEIFGAHFIPEGTASEQLDALNEFQEKPCLTPPCKCGRGGYGWRGFKGRLKCLPFTGAREAGEHQERLEAIIQIQNIKLGTNTQ